MAEPPGQVSGTAQSSLSQEGSIQRWRHSEWLGPRNTWTVLLHASDQMKRREGKEAVK